LTRERRQWNSPDHGGGARVSRSNREVGRVDTCSRVAVVVDGFHTTLDQTITACLPCLGDFGFFDLRIDDTEVVRTARAYQDPRIEELLRPTRWVPQLRADMNVCALTTGQSALHPDTDEAWYRAIATSEGHLDVLRELAFRSMISVPLRFGAEVVGALTLFFGASGRRHDEYHLRFADELAALVVPIVVNARLLERQRRAEEALRESEARLRLAVEAGQLGIWDWDIATDRILWSERIYEMYGIRTRSSHVSIEDFFQTVIDEDRPFVRESLQAAMRDGSKSYGTEFRVKVDGRHRWINSRGAVIRDATGRAIRMIGASHDTTDRVDRLAAERAERERLEILAHAGQLLSSSLDPEATLRAIATALVPTLVDWCRIDLVDDTGSVRHVFSHHVNPELARRGSEIADKYESSPSDVGSVAWVAATARPLALVLEPEGLAKVDDELVAFITETRIHSTLMVPLVARGRTLGVLTLLNEASRPRPLGNEDIPLFTELASRAALALDNARLYAEAEAARKEAETANRAKDEFLAILGHELRNPLAPIVSALQLMERRGDASTRRERTIIERQVRHLSRLVDDLLDVSRIVRGRVDISRERLDLRNIIDKAFEMTRPLFEQRELRMELSVGAGPAWVDGDPVRLAQIVGNLLSNAAKFSSRGGRVTVTLGRVDDQHELVVRDEGAGISPELLPGVFELFVQGPQTLDRSQGGLGLGLAIVANLVERHGGTVHAESDGPGRGATFRVRLPQATAPATPRLAARPVTPHPRGGRLLIVDDNQDAAELIADLLRDSGFEVVVEPDALRALDLAERFAPQLAILDIGLPTLDGFELARRLRALPALADLRLIALTGYGLSSDRERAEAAGFDLHLIKPVVHDTLVAHIDALLSS
jgi:PAS domain S-box-containing protein